MSDYEFGYTCFICTGDEERIKFVCVHGDPSFIERLKLAILVLRGKV